MASDLSLDDLLAYLESLPDRAAIVRLRRQIAAEKAARFDSLLERARGLQRALETYERVQADLHRQLEERDQQVEKLREEYNGLRNRNQANSASSTKSERLIFFDKLKTVMTQLPTMHKAVENGADLSARDVLALLAPLQDAFGELGFSAIGEAGGETEFDPTRHKAVGRKAAEVGTGDPVRVRYVGYLYSDEVVTKAEVTPIERS
ncbi:MAG: nucleotide exchange factor GrpE [Chloroflexi bacterium]|nr:nucleotide exchange factor GrpE [Chloroflexota bacterium]